MAKGGYTGKILEVNLTSGKISQTSVDDETLRKFIGGSGLAAKLFLDRVSPQVEPLSPQNTLFIMTGPLQGTNLPGAGRFNVSAKSPLTSIWGEGNCGGTFGPELKFAGWDGIIIEGASNRPVYLFIDDDKVEIRDASDFWGKDSYETTDMLTDKIGGGKKVKVLAIGQAGENLVKYAAIIHDKADAIGRCGLGAVMGSKKLKAVVVRGTAKASIAMPEDYNKTRREALDVIKESMVAQSLHAMGTDAALSLGMMTGDVPSKNWSLGENLEGSEALGGPIYSEKYLTRTHACYACPIACKRVVQVKEGPYKGDEQAGPEYETCCTFGTLVMNNDLEAVIKINEMCNRYGLDTISCGSTIAFAIDCFENGVITEGDTGGIELSWGNVEGVIKMVEKIAQREGFGDILAEGSRSAAKKIGKNASDFAVEVKGLEPPMHDPRGYHGMGLAYAMSNRGACHMQHMALFVEQGQVVYPEIVGLKEDYEGQTSEGKAEMTLICENLGMVCSSAVFCVFVMACLKVNDLVEFLRTTTGFDYSLDELMQCGERVWLLKRGLNNLMGVTAADDRLPKKILTPVNEGAAAGSVPDIELMLKEYYELRKFNANGYPSREKLEDVGLSDLARRLYT
ncbi:putative oxidoreductase YdhV [subsurface metagenome]